MLSEKTILCRDRRASLRSGVKLELVVISVSPEFFMQSNLLRDDKYSL